MKRVLIISYCMACLANPMWAQQATIQEQPRVMTSYPFSDPNPVATPSNLYYPYFRFDGFAAKGVQKEWKTVVLENDYIRLSLFPEVGGKIWGAVDKTTGKEFVYDNSVAKFRDIAMRGPWTSGGIEFNFGIIGHAPSSSTPVDYLVKEKADGSVSCYIFSYEWVTRTAWTVEVNLPKDKGYFTTHTTWYNQSSLDQPYYQWMNAGYPVGKEAQFCYPGNRGIGHGGEVFAFPVDEQGRDIGWYEKNNFGGSKSYHILGYYNDYYGVYWHGEDFGSIHHADFDEKLGMKIFLWGLSREGAIWEDLLTDTDGQYIELQSGRMFNQPASGSGYTPYKHFAFAPQMTDEWTEYWYPVKGIQGVSKASRIGALHVTREAGNLKLAFSPLETLSTEVKLYNDGKLVETLPLSTKVLEPVYLTAPSIPEGKLKIIIGDDQLVYSDNPEDYQLERPTTLPEDFDWDSAFGLYTEGEQWMNQKVLDKAERCLKASLEKEPCFAPALVRLASLYYREGRYAESLALSKKALAMDTYDGEANYLYALANRALGHLTEAKAAFSIASFSAEVRTAAYEQLGELFAVEKDWKRVLHYAEKALTYNAKNLDARQLLAVAYRYLGETEKAAEQIGQVLADLPLYHPVRFEQAWLEGRRTPEQLASFSSLIRNELPQETYLELAGWYERIGLADEALALLACAGDYPVALYRAAYLWHQQGREEKALAVLEQANAASPDFVFPFRPESMAALQWAAGASPSWKVDYYQGLILWANHQPAEALAKLEACTPTDYAPFYLSRAQLKQGAARLADLQRAEQIDASWRVGLALLNEYTAAKDWQQAVETGKRYAKKYPHNYYIGLKYANALCEAGQYKACIALLDKLEVLPNEGAYAGRAVYRAANLFQAMEQIAKKQYGNAAKSIEVSKEWPENLGVGKPYDDQIDTRVEDYLEAKVYAGKGNDVKAKEIFGKVAQEAKKSSRFMSAELLSALSLRALGRTTEADAMAAAWTEQHPDSKPAQWCAAVYRGDWNAAERLLEERNNPTDTTPWETGYRDTDFDLIARLAAQLEQK